MGSGKKMKWTNKWVKKENQNEKDVPSCLFPGALQQEWTHQVLDIPIFGERKAVSKTTGSKPIYML